MHLPGVCCNAAQLVRYHRLCVVHSVAATGRPEDIANTIGEVAQHQYRTRAAGQHALPRIRTEAGRRRQCYSAVRTTTVSRSMSAYAALGVNFENTYCESRMITRRSR